MSTSKRLKQKVESESVGTLAADHTVLWTLSAELLSLFDLVAFTCFCNELDVWFPVIRLAGQTAARMVSLFLDGDVTFLPDNSFPSHLQLLKVGFHLHLYMSVKSLSCFSCACCNIYSYIYNLLLLLFMIGTESCLCLLWFSYLKFEVCLFFTATAGGIMESLSVGLSAHGLCVFITS